MFAQTWPKAKKLYPMPILFYHMCVSPYHNSVLPYMFYHTTMGVGQGDTTVNVFLKEKKIVLEKCQT